MSNNSLEQMLNQNEKMLWMGSPPQTVLIGNDSLTLVGVSSLSIVILILFYSPALASALVLFIVLLCYGFYHNYKVRKNTVYCVTNQRAIILEKWPSEDITSCPFDILPTPLTLIQNADGYFLFLGRLVWGEMQVVRWPKAIRRSIPPLFHVARGVEEPRKLIEERINVRDSGI